MCVFGVSFFRDSNVCVYTRLQVYELEGVVQVHNTHFWTLCTGNHHGTLVLDVMAGTDWRRTISAARAILIQVSFLTRQSNFVHVLDNIYNMSCMCSTCTMYIMIRPY